MAFAQVTRSSWVHDNTINVFHTFPSVMESYLVWDWAMICSTNPPSCIGKNDVCWRESKVAGCTRNGKLSCQSVQHMYSWKGWSQLVLIYQGTLRTCLLELCGKVLGHARHTGSGLPSMFLWLWQQLLEDRANVCLPLEKRWLGVSPQKVTLNSNQKYYLLQ